MRPECPSTHPTLGSACSMRNTNHPLCTDGTNDWDNPGFVAKVEKKAGKARLREIATQVPAVTSVLEEGAAEAAAGSRRAADALSDEQRVLVATAIDAVAARLDEFTVDDVYDELDGAVPINKGIGAMMRLAIKRDVVGSTGKRAPSQRGRDTTRDLTVYYSLIK